VAAEAVYLEPGGNAVFEDYLLNPETFEVRGRGHIFHYPWGFVFRSPDGDDVDEPAFFSLAAVLRFLRVSSEDCIPARPPSVQRFRLVGATKAFCLSSARFHTYSAAAKAIGRLCLDYRLEHQLAPPPEEPQVEDANTRHAAPLKILGDWYGTIDTVHPMKCKRDGQPDYVVRQRHSCAALWCQDQRREEIWRDDGLMRHHYGLTTWPAGIDIESYALPTFSIVRRNDRAFVAGGYHSLIHAIDVARSLTEMSGVEAVALGGPSMKTQEFDLCRAGAVVRLDEHGIRQFWAKAKVQGTELRDQRDYPIRGQLS